MNGVGRLAAPLHGRSAPTLPGSGAIAAAALLLALLAAPLLVSQADLNDLGQAVVLGMFAISFNILFRYGGLLSFGHAAFFGSAAYLAALAYGHLPWLPLPVLVLGVATVTGCLGLLVGQLCVTRSGAYFSMTTLAVAAFVYTVAFKWNAVTGGTDGLGSFVPDTIVLAPGWRVSQPSIASLYWMTMAFLVPMLLSAWLVLEHTPFGNSVILTCRNEIRAASLGYDTHGIKRANFMLSATVAGGAGALWALQNGLVSTDSIELALSTKVIFMAFIGGTGWFWGPMLGSIVYVFGADRLSVLTPHWQLWIGLVFIAAVLFCPGGIAGLRGRLARSPDRHDRSPDRRNG